MSTQEIVITGVELMGPVLSSVALWLQLHLQSRSERERRRFLLSVATTLPVDSRIQVHHGDGTCLALIVDATWNSHE